MTYFDGYDPTIRMAVAMGLIIVILLVSLVVMYFDNRNKQREIDELKSNQRRQYRQWGGSSGHQSYYRED